MAVLSIVIVIATFMGMNSWCQLLVDKTGLTVSPWLTGDVVVNTIEHGIYKTQIHKPVFQGLFGERREGFVQIDWVKVKELPAQIAEDIDYDNDGKTDFSIEYAGKDQVILKPHNPKVLFVDSTYKMEDSYIVRVRLDNSSS